MDDPWVLRWEGFGGPAEGMREALCAVGNGYVVTRGAAPESAADGIHYPGTYIAGCHNRARSRIAGREVDNEDLLNCPNWLPLTFRLPDSGQWFGRPSADPPGAPPDTAPGPPPGRAADVYRVLSTHQELDLRRAVLTRHLRLEDAEGRIVRVVQRRIAHMGQPHLVALECTFLPENWSGRLEVRSALDGTVANTGVARYRGLAHHHLVPAGQGGTPDGTAWLQAGTTGSPLRIAEAARTALVREGAVLPAAWRTAVRDGWVGQETAVEVGRDRPVTVEKTVALYTSRDRAVEDPLRSALRLAARAGGFDELLRSHVPRWDELWRRCLVDVDAPGTGTLRLYAFHLLQTFSEHSTDLDVGVPARGLHGEAYRGHIFWDELFILPFFNLRFPDRSRAVLRYRYRRLEEARQAARDAGLAGAMYPWQSGTEGREETQRFHLNPRSGRWLPDHSHLQRHVGSAVAYNVWQYYEATGDTEFLAHAGAEMLLEVARFWGSLARYDHARDRWSINGVMGPDEYHDRYPWADGPGLDNNAYTNVMAAWVLGRALETVGLLPAHRRGELLERLGLYREELDRWEEVRRRLVVPFHDGVISQFEGYERLEELDWDAYRRRYGDIRRLDRILEAEGDSVNRYRASKQADVLMLCYLLSGEELRALLAQLGCPSGPELLPRMVDYYLRRTTHGSTLSAVVHSWVLARSDRRASWRFFDEALATDVHDIQGGTTAEGIHLGAMAGVVDLVTRCYTGLETRGDVLRLSPGLPPELACLDVGLRYRGHWGIRLHVDCERMRMSLPQGPAPPVRVEYKGREALLGSGGRLEWPL